jgi:hypothetical protein
MVPTSGISYRLTLHHPNSEKKQGRSECLAFQVRFFLAIITRVIGLIMEINQRQRMCIVQGSVLLFAFSVRTRMSRFWNYNGNIA